MENTERRGMNRCAAKLCTNNSKNCNYSFFKFPTDNNRSNLWTVACNREDLLEKSNLHNLSYRLCGMHFENRMFLNDSHNRLQKDAFPSIFPSMEGTSSGSTEQPSQDDAVTISTTQSENAIKVQQNILSSPPIIQSESSDTKEIVIKPEPNFLSLAEPQTGVVLSSHSARTGKVKRKFENMENENSDIITKVIKMEKVSSTIGSTSGSATLLEKITLEDYKKLTYKFCPSENFANFINALVTQRQKLPKGRQYSDDFKNHCLSLYFSGCKLYKQSLTNIFCLPSIRTLQKFMQAIKLRPGINSIVFETIKKKVQNFRKIDKLCILCVDEISIKPNLFLSIDRDEIIGFESVDDVKREFKPALAATVIMARGLCRDWKQPLAYYFVNSTCPCQKLKDIILNTITELNNIDMTVVGAVSNMEASNIRLAKLLDVTAEAPFFIHNNKKIVYLFKVPHLLKLLRNNFMTHTFVIDNTMILWDFLKKFYEHDKKFSVRAAPKLSDSHISPGNFEKTQVKYASQIFSNTVAAGMNLYIRFGKLPPEAKATEQFIRKINNLFDILNSSSNFAASKYQQASNGEADQNQCLLECYAMFDSLQVLSWKGDDVTGKIKCLWGWKTTINGVISLWEILKTFDFKFLLTRRINQDCLEDFFGPARKQGGNNIKPTPIQFIRAFKKCFCLDLLHSGTENCERDNVEVLLEMQDVRIFQAGETPVNASPKLGHTDYQTSDVLQQNFTRYVGSYLIKKCLGIHSCESCEFYAKQYDDLDDTSLQNFVSAYTHPEELFDSLYIVPNKTFVHYIACLEILFQQNFESLAIKDKVIQEFVNIFKTVQFVHPCNNFPYEYLIKLYARLRIYYTLKTINRNFKTKRRNRKLIIWRNQ